MGRYRVAHGTAVADDVPAGSLDDVWWWCLRDLGDYFHRYGMSSKSVVAVRNEWVRLDGSDIPIPERVALLSSFCVRLGVEEWAVRARTLLCQARARRLREERGEADRRQTVADERRRRLSAPGYSQPKGVPDE